MIERLYSKAQFLQAAELGEVSLIDAYHICSLLDESAEISPLPPFEEYIHTSEFGDSFDYDADDFQDWAADEAPSAYRAAISAARKLGM